MRLIYVLVTILALASATTISDVLLEEWQTFKLKHNKTYKDSAEDALRLRIFMKNKIEIEKHNALFYIGLSTFTMGLNNFSDMLPHEFKARNGLKLNLLQSNLLTTVETASYFPEPANVALPPAVDWRTAGAVTEIKNQGACGSCWAFSATGALEGQHFRKTGTLISLSEQNLIDCSQKYGNQGCDGGLMDYAFQYVKGNHGIDTEISYPYHARDMYCKYNSANSGCNCTGYVDLPRGNELSLQAAVATIGPVSVGIDAGHDSFMKYNGGIYFEPNCSSTQLDHGVLVVGYNTTDDGKDFWLVKNSWGTHWGEQGYIRMSRNRRNNCGIASMASYPLM